MKKFENFKMFFTSLTADEKRDLSRALDKSVNFLSQIAHGRRACSASLAVEIEKQTNKSVICECMVHDVDWNYIRGTKKKKNTVKSKEKSRV